MTYLQVLFGALEPFERSEGLISESLGFKVCATAIEAKHGNGREED
jgi:hypothetical protein